MARPHDDPDGAEVFRFDQSDALLRKVMESAAVGMTLIGPHGRMLYANRAFEAMLGHAEGQCLGANAHDMIVEDSRQLATLRLDQLMRGEVEELHGEYRMLHHDGHPLWVSVFASLLRSEVTGRPLYAIVQVLNIEAQKRAEAALIYAESRWNSALDAANQGVWDHDARTDTVYYSRSWKTMRGFDPDAVVDSRRDVWLERLHPEDRERIRSTVDRQSTGQDGYDVLEYRERHRDGHYLWILSRGRPIEWSPDGEPLRTVGTDTDITRLKTIEAQLAAEKERLRVTLQSIGDGVISIDAKGRITFMNTTAEDMTGWTLEEALGHRLEQVFSIVEESTGRTAVSPVSRCLKQGMVAHLDEDVVLIGRHAERRDVQSSASPLKTPGGETIGAVLVFQDVTKSRAMQKQLAHTATHDTLTGLPNRLAFERAMLSVSDQARREMRSHALCFIDLDRFKPVNDTAGHAAGDALLCQVAEVIRSGCRRQDFAARIGGDEFAVLLADCPVGAARRVAQNLVDAIAALEFRWDDKIYRIGASIGITAITSQATNPADLLDEADSACYVAKANGRGRVAIYGNEEERPLTDPVALRAPGALG
jgi:diguanylate cyclase (GGDEF)-like protein/PAS domain S-box-containing protein